MQCTRNNAHSCGHVSLVTRLAQTPCSTANEHEQLLRLLPSLSPVVPVAARNNHKARTPTPEKRLARCAAIKVDYDKANSIARWHSTIRLDTRTETVTLIMIVWMVRYMVRIYIRTISFVHSVINPKRYNCKATQNRSSLHSAPFDVINHNKATEPFYVKERRQATQHCRPVNHTQQNRYSLWRLGRLRSRNRNMCSTTFLRVGLNEIHQYAVFNSSVHSQYVCIRCLMNAAAAARCRVCVSHGAYWVDKLNGISTDDVAHTANRFAAKPCPRHVANARMQNADPTTDQWGESNSPSALSNQEPGPGARSNRNMSRSNGADRRTKTKRIHNMVPTQ